MKKLVIIWALVLGSCTALKPPYTKAYVRAKCTKTSDTTAYNPYTRQCLILRKDGLYHVY